jgi:hypothetical protein
MLRRDHKTFYKSKVHFSFICQVWACSIRVTTHPDFSSW